MIATAPQNQRRTPLNRVFHHPANQALQATPDTVSAAFGRSSALGGALERKR